MAVEPWILKLGSQVSSNLKHSLYLKNSMKFSSKKHGVPEKQTIGILSFEVANIMSKVIHLHKALTDAEILKLKNEIFKSEGIRTLVCCDERKLLDLAFVEKLDDLNRVASAVSRLGKKCTIPALQGFEHVYGDIVSGMIDVKELSFLVKDMESMIRKMERYVTSTANLYAEMEVMNELEIATKKFRQNQLEESRKTFEQKLSWQKQDVDHLKDVSLWNQTYDKVVEVLARTVCTIYARIHVAFRDTHSLRASISRSGTVSTEGSRLSSLRRSGHLNMAVKVQKNSVSSKTMSSCASEKLQKKSVTSNPILGLQKLQSSLFLSEDNSIACGMAPRRLLMECLTMSSSVVSNDNYEDHGSQISGFSCTPINIQDSRINEYRIRSKASAGNGVDGGAKCSLMMHALPCTVGGSALALHYANVIIVIEKLLRYPHLVGEEARDDLYQMLPNSLRKILKKTMKSSAKDMAIYDAPLAHDWRERADLMLKWLIPLAKNMIRWQSERNFEQQEQIVSRTNVLLLQTLYFADRERTEAAICELLVGLNYICRYEQQQNALLDCASSFEMEQD